jgi:hypothetical protein
MEWATASPRAHPPSATAFLFLFFLDVEELSRDGRHTEVMWITE